MAEGIRKRHTKACPTRSGGRCRCDGSFQAFVYSPRDRKKLYKSFTRESEAKSWRADAKRAMDHGTLRTPNGKTLEEAAATWLERAERGEIRNRSGRPYRPSTLRIYRQSLKDRLLPVLGSRRLNTITTFDLQELVDGWQADGLSAATIRNAVKPLQAIYRRARSREGLPTNPTYDLELPAPEPKEVEIVAPQTAARLLDALPIEERSIWATALYAGLRYGELRALRWRAVDMTRGIIEVRESWDPKVGPIEPKTRKSRRAVPMPSLLRTLLLDRRNRRGDVCSEELIFPVREGVPFEAERLYRLADRA